MWGSWRCDGGIVPHAQPLKSDLRPPAAWVVGHWTRDLPRLPSCGFTVAVARASRFASLGIVPRDLCNSWILFLGCPAGASRSTEASRGRLVTGSPTSGRCGDSRCARARSRSGIAPPEFVVGCPGATSASGRLAANDTGGMQSCSNLALACQVHHRRFPYVLLAPTSEAGLQRAELERRTTLAGVFVKVHGGS